MSRRFAPPETRSTTTALYLEELRRYPLLEQDAFDTLMAEAKKGDRDAMNRIVQANLRFVVQVAHDYRGSSLGFEDLVAEGNLGLIKAVERFDPELGHQFTTYAVWWIRNAIQRAIRRSRHPIRLPSNRFDDYGAIQRASKELAHTWGREVSDEEAAGHLGMTRRRADAALSAADSALSLDGFSGEEEEGWPLHDVIADSAPAPDMDAERNQLAEILSGAMSRLASRDAEILRRSFGLEGEPMTLSQVGAHYGISKERIRQIRDRALSKLRVTMAVDELLDSVERAPAA